MLIKYNATPAQDIQIDKCLKKYAVTAWYSPEEYFYVLETKDSAVVTVLTLLGIECHVVDTELGWHEYAFGKKQP